MRTEVRQSRVLPVLMLLLAVSGAVLSCVLTGCGGEPALPKVVISAPPNNSEVGLGETISIRATATHATGVTIMELWVDDALYTSGISALAEGESPFGLALDWTPQVVGSHRIVVRAYDLARNMGESSPITLVVVGQPLEPSPTATSAISPSPTSTTVAVPTHTPTHTATSVPPTVAPSPIPPTPTPTLAGRIAFVSDRDGNDEIYVMNVDGSGVTRLTNHPDGDSSPTWSPDGTRVAFVSYRHGSAEIYVVNADGSGLRNLTDNPETDYWPSWSPDSKRIAFGRVLSYNNSEIFVMSADGSGQTNLTNNLFQDANPTWSPDGSRIAFVSDRDGGAEIYVMNADGGGVIRLTNDPASDVRPFWSPDSTRLVFGSDRDGNEEIYVMNADGSGQTNLTNSPDYEWQPSWSPDVARIAFRCPGGICIANSDGSGVTTRTNNIDDGASWSPDGRYIAFVSYRDPSPWGEIYVMNADGTWLMNLTNNPASDTGPSWSPR